MLNCHSWFSLRYGTLSPEQLITQLLELGYTSAALTDINTTSGCLDFVRISNEMGLHPVIGVEFREDGLLQFVALAINNDGFELINRHLSSKLTEGATLAAEAPEQWNGHVWVIYPLKNIPKRKLFPNEFIGLSLQDLKSVWKPRDPILNRAVVLQAFTFPDKAHNNIHRLLRAIDQNTLLSLLDPLQCAAPDAFLLPRKDLVSAFSSFPEVIARSLQLLESCNVEFEFGVSKNRKTFTGSKVQDRQLLEKLSLDGMQYRYGKKNREAQKRLKHELEVIDKLGFTPYFLITEDIIRYARHRGFFHVGRGSGANSIAAYCLQITDVDPIELDLYFERFINPHRTSPPDFDLDFSWRDRDEILNYIFQRYGTEHTALIATYTTFQDRAVIRELGKVFGLPKSEIDILSGLKQLPKDADQISRLIFRYGEKIHGFPNHLGIHAGGVIISESPIYRYTATQMPPKGLPITQFDMYVSEEVGLYKYDILSQRGLGHIREATELILENRQISVDIHRVSEFKKDLKIKQLIKTGRTMGCFYVESPAMRMLLSKLKCEDYITLVAASSIIRPGVAKSGMMREYIHRFHHPESFSYIHPKMEELLKETYGVMVYQEDVIKVAHHFAGLDPADADILRRGMSGKFRSAKAFQLVADKFMQNCRDMGYPEAVYTEVWRQMESFSGYSFSKAHSASFAVESFQSLYLRAHFPLEFMTAVLNNFGGFYKTQDYVHEARMLGAKIEAPCVNRSMHLNSIFDDSIYLGFVLLHQLEERSSAMILRARAQSGPFLGLADFVSRVNIGLEQVLILIRVGAFRFTSKPKKELLWDAHLIVNKTSVKVEKPAQLFHANEPDYKFPNLEDSFIENAYDEIELLGFPLCSPFDLIAPTKDESIRAKELCNNLGKQVQILGSVVAVKDTRTVKGERMNFATFVDQDGYFFDSTHFPQVVKQSPFRGRGIYRLKGKVACEFGFFSLETSYMEKIPYLARGY
jgi:DNA-directed DNA polymerase III PolC